MIVHFCQTFTSGLGEFVFYIINNEIIHSVFMQPPNLTPTGIFFWLKYEITLLIR